MLFPLPKPAGSEEIAIEWKQTHPIIPLGISRSATANKKLKPFIKCSVAANSQLKRLYPTRWDRLDTQAMVANRAPAETAHLLQAADLRPAAKLNSTAAVCHQKSSSLQVAAGDWLNSNAQFVVSKAESGDSPCSSGPSSLDILEVSTGEVVM